MICPVSKKDFMGNADTLSLHVDGLALPLEPRLFSSGSFGWHASANIVREALVDRQVQVVLTVSAVIRDSKNAPAKSVERSRWSWLLCRRRPRRAKLQQKKKANRVWKISKLGQMMARMIAKSNEVNTEQSNGLWCGWRPSMPKLKCLARKKAVASSPKTTVPAVVVPVRKWSWFNRRPAIESFFFPYAKDTGLPYLVSLLEGCRHSLDLAMFTFTNDILADAVVHCHRRGVRVRIILDDAQAEGPASVSKKLVKVGLPVRHDANFSHMHHKFAVIDGETVITGSFNWTVAATTSNREHVVILHNRGLAKTFNEEFSKLWIEFKGNKC